MEKLRELVFNFRRVMECLNPSDFVGTSLSENQFPLACCDDASLLLAAYLIDNGFCSTTLIRGEYGGNDEELHSHVWLNCEGFNIDITADQFNEDGYYNPPVIIAKENEFLDTFEETDIEIADFRERFKEYADEKRLLNEFESCYKVVLLQLSAQA